MKTLRFSVGHYVTPQLSVIEINTEGVLCVSGEKLWYDGGGSGDFDYDVDTDDTWA